MAKKPLTFPEEQAAKKSGRSALEALVEGGKREAEVEQALGIRPRRNPMAPESIGTLSDEELRQKYPALRGAMGGGFRHGQGKADFSKMDDSGTPDGSPVTFVPGAAPAGGDA